MNGIYQTEVPNYTCTRGKVRDIYAYGDNMLIIVTTDRISAFDWVFPNVIPDKGRVLQNISSYWADTLNLKYHEISTELNHLPEDFRKPEFRDRAMLVEKADVIPFECVVRGYLAGSAWKEYKKTGSVCGIKLPKGLKENQHLHKPIFTPATKAPQGQHDENVSFDYMSSKIGLDLAAELESLSLEIYTHAADLAWQNGIIIADTKFEFGVIPHSSNILMLIDEVLTPDSSRFWPLEEYRLDGPINSFDKQYLRDWLDKTPWDKNSPPPPLPDDVIYKTRDKYLEAFEKITGQPL